MYKFCIQRLYKSKFCMIMNVQNMYIKFLHIYKKVQTVQNFCIYKQCTKYTKHVFCTYKIMYKLYKTYTTS